MKTLSIILLTLILSVIFVSCDGKKEPVPQKPKNYTVILDLSDRILVGDQLEKDMYIIEQTFKLFEKQSRNSLVLTAKNRFAVKIIPQKNSPLQSSHFEDLLCINLDEIDIQEKNKKLLIFANSLSQTLSDLKHQALFSKKNSDYFGVDIWAYLNNKGQDYSKVNFDNYILMLTDGYFDFENSSHVITINNQHTSTKFLKDLKSPDWLEISNSQKYGLMPIKLDKETKWIVAGLCGKKENDILQTEKISFFWKKWLNESGVSYSNNVLNDSKSAMSSIVLEKLENNSR